jgi:hypothetical protein
MPSSFSTPLPSIGEQEEEGDNQDSFSVRSESLRVSRQGRSNIILVLDHEYMYVSCIVLV